MPPLRNPRHEAFVRGLLEGKSEVDAFEAAGYARDRGNAARLMANESVRARLVELQKETAGETKLTVEGLLDQLEAARAKATDLEQLSAAVRAIEAKAKISGLMAPQKVEVGGPGSFDGLIDTRDIIDEMLKYVLNPYHVVTEEDRESLVAMMERHNAEMEAYIDGIKALPAVNLAYERPTALPSPAPTSTAKEQTRGIRTCIHKAALNVRFWM